MKPKFGVQSTIIGLTSKRVSGLPVSSETAFQSHDRLQKSLEICRLKRDGWNDLNLVSLCDQFSVNPELLPPRDLFSDSYRASNGPEAEKRSQKSPL